VPLDPPSQPLTGARQSGLIAPLTRLAGELGYRIERRELPEAGPGGWCDRREKLIVIAHGEPNAEVRTLIHEVAHAIVGAAEEPLAYDREEVIVETATFIASQAVGLDTGGESIPYVAGWGEAGALDAVRALAGVIDAVARRIEDAVAPLPDPAGT
jgi:hypothetical protein